jgi:halocyanin-like protein
MNRFSTGRLEAGDMTTNEVSRRGFMAAAGTTAAAAASTNPAAAQEDGGDESSSGNESDDGGGEGGGTEVPVFGSYLGDANGYAEADTVDARGEESVTVAVGAGDTSLAFDPATIWVSPGTTITWEWTGEGGGHNVVTNEGPAELDSGDLVSEEGATYEYEVTEEDAGITTYKCEPHETQGMKGGIAVGDDVETTTVDTGGGGPSVTIPDEALGLTVATFIAMTTTLGLGYFFMKYGGDYQPQ